MDSGSFRCSRNRIYLIIGSTVSQIARAIHYTVCGPEMAYCRVIVSKINGHCGHGPIIVDKDLALYRENRNQLSRLDYRRERDRFTLHILLLVENLPPNYTRHTLSVPRQQVYTRGPPAVTVCVLANTVKSINNNVVIDRGRH